MTDILKIKVKIMKTQIKTSTNKKEDFIDKLASVMPPEMIERAKREAEKKIFRIRLSELRKKWAFARKK